MTTAPDDVPGRLLTAGFVTLWIVAFLEEMSFGLMVHLPGYMTTLGATETGIGVVYAAGALVALTLRPAMGRVIDVWGRKPTILAAGALYAAALMSYVPVDSYGPALFGVHIVFTTTEIVLFTTVLTLATDLLPPERRTQGLALLGISGLLPIGLGSIAGDLILGDTEEFARLFVIAAGLAAASWVLAFRLTAPRIGEGGRPARRSFGRALRQRDLGPIWLATFVFAVAVAVLFTFLRTYIDTVGFGSVGLYLGVYSVVAIASRLAMSRSLGTVDPLWLAGPGLAGIAAQFAVLALVDGTSGLIVAGAVGGLGHGLMFPVLTSLVADRAAVTERGTAFAVFSGIFDAVLLVVAPVVGLIIDVAGYDTGFGVVAVAMLGGLAGFLGWERTLRAAAGRDAAPATTPESDPSRDRRS